MGRAFVVVVFAGMAAATAGGAVASWVHALDASGGNRVLVAVMLTLRALVAIAFFAFVLMRPEVRRRRREPAALLACGLAMGALVAMQPASRASSTSLLLTGDIVALAGCLIILGSVLFLGRCFGVLPEARGLVARGPYRLVRHPVYLGEITATGGLLIAAPTVLNFVLALTLLCAQITRMGMEERELAFAFPEYAEYAARTPRLLPIKGY